MKVIIAYGNTFMLETTMIVINSTVLLTLLLSFCRALLLLLLSSGREQCYGSRRLIQGQLLLTLSYCPSQVFAEALKDTVFRHQVRSNRALSIYATMTSIYLGKFTHWGKK